MAKTTRIILLAVMITSATCTQASPSAMTPYTTPTSTTIATPTPVPTSTPSPSPVPTATFTPGQEEGFVPEVRLLAAFDVSTWSLHRGFDWSPDGQAIVFFSAPEMIPWIARAPAFTPQRLAEQRGGQPVWSPDGARIAFVGSRGPEMHPPTIWVVQADGSGLRDLLPGEKAIRSVSSGKYLGPWLDDRTLVFMDHRGTGVQSLVTIDVATGEVEGVCSAQSEFSPPTFGVGYHWAPSLERVVAEEPQMRLLLLLDQTNCRERTFPRPNEFHAWAPSGDYLLFSHWEWESGQGDPQPVTGQVPTLYIWDVIQDEIKWTGPEGGYEGALSPDGEHLAFFLLGNPRYEGQRKRIIGSDLVPGTPFPLFLVVLDIHTEEVLGLVPLGEITDFYDYTFGIWAWFDQRRPVWSPDGEQIVYWGEGDDLWIMRWDGTDQQRLTEGLGIIYAVWSPDGGRLALATSDRLWIIERP